MALRKSQRVHEDLRPAEHCIGLFAHKHVIAANVRFALNAVQYQRFQFAADRLHELLHRREHRAAEADEVAATVAMVRALMPDEIGISVSYPLPGTPFHDRVVAEMGEHHNWQESADLAMMFRGSYTTDYYRALAAWLHKDHRLRLARNGIAKLLGGSHGRSGSIPWRRILLLPWYVTMRRLYRSKMRRSGGPFQFDAAEKWVFEGGGDETARADDPTVVGDAAQGGTVPETADLAQSNSVASDPITSINLRR